MLDELQLHRQILYDLSVHSLEPMGGMYERLAYVANLRDPSTGIYSHERLCAVFGEEGVGQALADCHEELFERLLESPLALQEEDLLSLFGRSARREGRAPPGMFRKSQDLDSSPGPGLPQETLLFESACIVRTAAGEEAHGSFR